MKAILPDKKKRQLGFKDGLAAGFGLLLLILLGGMGLAGAPNGSGRATSQQEGRSAAIRPIESLSSAFERVAKVVEPSVVNVSAEQVVEGHALQDLFGGANPFGFFFDQPRDLRQKSLGSGFIVDPRGYILTNHHVVNNASKIKVRMQDGRELRGTVVGTDPQTDLAVIKVDASNLPVLKLAAADEVQVGQWVLAFGSPFGLEQTMTAGIISAKGRFIGSGSYDNFLQTDAAINPGNSGGPLVNLEGEVVGINTMILSQSGGFQGVGLAIPATMASSIYPQLIRSGKVTRGWLGVSIQELTPELAKGFNVKPDRGVLIAHVEPDSPAAKAGLRPGDIVLEYNGRKTDSPRDLSMAVAESKVGSPARLTLLRGNQTVSMSVLVSEKPAEMMARTEPPREPRAPAEGGKLGLTVVDIEAGLARQLNLPSTGGALVTDVVTGSPADEGGVQPGDLITEINGKPVRNSAELESAARNLQSGSTVLLRVIREGQNRFLAFELF